VVEKSFFVFSDSLLDDGDARLKPCCKMVTAEVSTSDEVQLLCQLA